mgnify:CR=1 FL=1
MDEIKLNLLIIKIACEALKIRKINKSDLLSYNKKISDHAANICIYAGELHHELFPECEEGVNNAETQDS